MDINTIMQLVSALGVPAVMAFLLLKLLGETQSKHEEEVKRLTETHSQDIKDMTVEMHNNNVEVISKLSDVAVALTKLADSIENKNEDA